jgi:hypothetical protein
MNTSGDSDDDSGNCHFFLIVKPAAKMMLDGHVKGKRFLPVMLTIDLSLRMDPACRDRLESGLPDRPERSNEPQPCELTTKSITRQIILTQIVFHRFWRYRTMPCEAAALNADGSYTNRAKGNPAASFPCLSSPRLPDSPSPADC